MKRSFLVLTLAVVVLGFSACCSNNDKCSKNCPQTEVSKCVQERAKCCSKKIAEKLELTTEQTEKVETLVVEKLSKEACAKKTFEIKMQEVLGADKFEQFKALSQCCSKKKHCAKKETCQTTCNGKKRCEKNDSCNNVCKKNCKQSCKKVCSKTENGECQKRSECPQKGECAKNK